MNGYEASGEQSKSCIMYFSTKCWDAAKILDDKTMQQIGSSDWLKGRKCLVDPALLNPVRASAGFTRAKLGKVSLPFPIPGLYLVPKGILDKAEAVLLEGQKDYWEKVEAFLGQYESARKEAELNLGEHFNEDDYPYDIRAKFGLHWQYITLSAPGETSVLDYDMFMKEKQKFEGLMEDARTMAVTLLRKEFAEMVRHMTDKLGLGTDGAPKVFRNSLVDKLQEFFSTFDARNSLFDDRELANLVAQARDVLGGADANDLRTDAMLRKTVRQAMSVIEAEIDNGVMDAPRRKIRFAGGAGAEQKAA